MPAAVGQRSPAAHRVHRRRQTGAINTLDRLQGCAARGQASGPICNGGYKVSNGITDTDLAIDSDLKEGCQRDDRWAVLCVDAALDSHILIEFEPVRSCEEGDAFCLLLPHGNDLRVQRPDFLRQRRTCGQRIELGRSLGIALYQRVDDVDEDVLIVEDSVSPGTKIAGKVALDQETETFRTRCPAEQNLVGGGNCLALGEIVAESLGERCVGNQRNGLVCELQPLDIGERVRSSRKFFTVTEPSALTVTS